MNPAGRMPQQSSGRIAPPRGSVRWLARRPPETLPVPRTAPSPRRPAPRYRAVPRWGLRQAFAPDPAVSHAEAAGAVQVTFAVRSAALILVLAAVSEGLAYLLLVVNRSGPVPAVLAFLAQLSVFVFGWLAVLAVLGSAVVLAAWLLRSRVQAYAALGTKEPRPSWQLWLYCLVPVLNLFTAPVLVLELAHAQARVAGATDRRSLFIRWWWVAWAALTIVVVACVAYSRAHGGLQHHADAMVFTAITYALAAAFLGGTLWVVRRIDKGPAVLTREEETRWLAV